MSIFGWERVANIERRLRTESQAAVGRAAIRARRRGDMQPAAVEAATDEHTARMAHYRGITADTGAEDE